MKRFSLWSIFVTGALLFGCSNSKGHLNQEQSSPSTMTEAKAKELALQEVGSGNIIEFSYENDDKMPHYEFKILNDGVEHEVEISALDGSVLKHDSKNHSDGISNPVLDVVGVREIGEKLMDGTIVRIRLEEEDHQPVYEVIAVDGTYKYEYEIDAIDGHVVNQEKELINQVTTTPNLEATLDVQKAKEIALSQVNGGVVTEISLDMDDSIPVYEVKVMADGMEYKYEISGVDGRIIKESTK